MEHLILGNQKQGRTGEQLPKCFIVKLGPAFGIFNPASPQPMGMGFFITSHSQLGLFHNLLETIPLELDIVVISDTPDILTHIRNITRRLNVFDALEELEPGKPMVVPIEQMFATMAATSILAMQEADEIRQKRSLNKKG